MQDEEGRHDAQNIFQVHVLPKHDVIDLSSCAPFSMRLCQISLSSRAFCRYACSRVSIPHYVRQSDAFRVCVIKACSCSGSPMSSIIHVKHYLEEYNKLAPYNFRFLMARNLLCNPLTTANCTIHIPSPVVHTSLGSCKVDSTKGLT